MDPEVILAGLNDEQRETATATSGPVVILAGAGTGKTRDISHVAEIANRSRRASTPIASRAAIVSLVAIAALTLPPRRDVTTEHPGAYRCLDR